jgi:hypothetical protein
VDNTSDTYDARRIAHLLGPIAAPQEYPHLTADLALLLDDMAPHTVPSVTVQALAQAVLASVDPQRVLNHLVRYLHQLSVPQAFWTAVQRHPQALASVVTIFASSQFLSSILWRRPQLLYGQHRLPLKSSQRSSNACCMTRTPKSK